MSKSGDIQAIALRFFLSIVAIGLSIMASALHIVGGEMTYEHVGGNSYEVTLIVYRDCNTTGGQLDDPAVVGVFDGNNNFISLQSLFSPQITFVSSDVDFDCQDVSAQVCVQRGFYQGTFNLPDNATGYTLVYQRCCRNSSIININNPDAWGSTYTTRIPAVGQFGNNSSPSFNSLPPVGICKDIALSYDNSATDPDGDSLVYRFCTPFHGGSDIDPIPNPPTPPPYVNIPWGPGFSVNNQITSNPTFSLDLNTGLLTGTPAQQGQFVIGVCVEEWRNGVLINEVRRDFQFNVVLCPDLVQSSFADFNNGLFCQGLGVQFDNQSVNGTTYFWSFGDGASSNDENPFHIYDEGGSYEVMLITDPGTSCADTVVNIYDISISPEPVIEDLGINCPDGTFDYSISGPLFDPVSYSWVIPDGAEAQSLDADELSDVSFPGAGSYDILLEVINSGGCSGSDEISVEVVEPPVAIIDVDEDPCVGLVIDFNNASLNAQSYQWNFGDSGPNSTSTSVSPSHTYPDQGAYEVTLIAFAQGACPSTVTQTVQAYLPLFVELDAIAAQCTEGNTFSFGFDGEYASSATLDWTITNTSGEAFNYNGTSISFPEQGNYLVNLTITDGPCLLSDEQFALVVDPVSVDFLSDDGGCVPERAFFQDMTTGGLGLEYDWQYGDGASSDFSGSTSHEYTDPGFFTVSLEVISTSGCLGSDIVVKPAYIQVLPTPEAAFRAEPPFADINSPLVQFQSLVDSLVECQYIIQGGGEFSGCDLFYEFPGGGSYNVTHIVTNEYGCEDRVVVPYIVRGHAFYAPNAITLNQDEVNDFFRPVVTGELAEYEILIYDRWGQVRFHSNNPDLAWVPEYSELGEYAYWVRIRDDYNTPVVYQGSFSVVR